MLSVVPTLTPANAGYVLCVLNHLTIMNTFSESEAGYGYIDENGDYMYVIYNHDCNAPDEEYPVMLKPIMAYSCTDDIPF